MTTMTDELVQRIWDHQRRARFNEKPKTLSMQYGEWVRLLAECTPGTDVVTFGPGTTKRFMGVRVRLRNYDRERTKKWHGAGAMTPGWRDPY
jgi:hypothetical protein